MRLLLITENFESPKRNNSTFKWLGKHLKVELMLDMLMKRDLGTFSKFRQHRKKCLLSPSSKLHVHKGFEVSRKSCLNLCSFRWLKRRRNLVRYLTTSGSLTLNIDLLLGLLNYKFAFENCNWFQVLYFWRKLQPFSQKIWKERIFETMNSVCVVKAFTRWFNHGNKWIDNCKIKGICFPLPH